MINGRTLRLPVWTDAALAAALFTVGLIEVVYADNVQGSLAVLALATLPLAWRRIVPLGVVLTTAGALTILTLQRNDTFTIGQLLGLMLATYTVAAACSAVVAAGGLAIVVGAALANSAAAGSSDPGDYVFPVILLGVPWLAGLGLRRWRDRADEMRALADTLAEERETHAGLVVAAERGRIARDLHDSLAQSLNAVVLHAEAAEQAMGVDDAQARTSLQRIQQVGRSSLAETRLILGVLRADDQVPGQPVLSQLDELLDQYRANGLEVTLEQAGETRQLPSPVQAAIYRIVQESLNNVARHSSGRRAWVTIAQGEDVHVEVRDDGPVPANGQQSGFGILGMRERATSLGGDLVAGLRDQSFVVEARIPYRESP